MSCTPIDDRLSDVDARVVGAAEADLDRLLSVSPSGEFAAAVRARIAAAPARGWRSKRLVLTLAAASVLIVAFALVGGLFVRDNGRPVVSPPYQDVVLRRVPQAGSTPVDQQTPLLLPPHRNLRHAPPPRVASGPEVMVDPSIAVAIRRLAIAARSTVLDDAAAGTPPRATPEPDALPVAEPLVVPKLVLTPADQTGGI